MNKHINWLKKISIFGNDILLYLNVNDIVKLANTFYLIKKEGLYKTKNVIDKKGNNLNFKTIECIFEFKHNESLILKNIDLDRFFN